MLKRSFFILFIFAVLCAAASAQNVYPPLTFIELWNNFAYYDTNLEKTGFASLLGRFEGKAGLNVFHFPLQVYAVYYGVTSQSEDYWNNSIFSGAGARLRPLEWYSGSGWWNEWLRGTKLYVESLSSSYQRDAESAEAANLKSTDVRAGVEVWHEWNLNEPDEGFPWGELWANLAYRSTNFSALDKDVVIFYFQPKIGRHLGNGIEAYLRTDLTVSDREHPWLNTFDFGAGIRFEPWRKAESNELFRKFKMFAEVLGLTYLKTQPADPVSMDVRFGIDFSYGR